MDPIKSKVKKIVLQESKGSSSGRDNGDISAMEMRSGGMLVQRRDSVSSQESASSIPTIKVRVKYGSSRHEIRISSQASFGELKKMVAEYTGVHHLDQKLMYKKKEDSRAYLDVSGMKDGSKIVLIEDSSSRERRCLEMIKSANLEKAKKLLNQIRHEVDSIQAKVESLESTASRGDKVEETEVDTVIDKLMNKLVGLGSIVAYGDLKLRRKFRVQKHIEALDVLKLRSSKRTNNRSKIGPTQQENLMDQMPIPVGKHLKQVRRKEQLPLQEQQQQKQQQPSSLEHSESVVITTKWEIFD